MARKPKQVVTSKKAYNRKKVKREDIQMAKSFE
jgi:hypothetical protein